MMKRSWLLIFGVLFAFALVVGGCGGTPSPDDDDPNGTPHEGVLDRYRGVYEDQGIQEIAVQFHLDEDGIIHNMSYRHLAYGDIDFLAIDEDHVMQAINRQLEQVIEYLEGRHISEIGLLHTPADFVDDVDAFTGATLRTNKVYSAMRDALNRGVYTPGDGVDDLAGDFEDGLYRGVFGDSGGQEVAVQFALENHLIKDMSFRHLAYRGVDVRTVTEGHALYPVLQQHQQIVEYLEGKDVRTSIAVLHRPGEFIDDVDAFTGATLRANKIYSAIRDALNRGIYSPANGVADLTDEYEDGTYRGFYSDRGIQEVSIQFTLHNHIIESIRFRHLAYGNVDFLDLAEDHALYEVSGQYRQAIEHLQGQDIRAAIGGLHNPGDFVDDVDGSTGATIRANKIYSAIRDALNRGVYSY